MCIEPTSSPFQPNNFKLKVVSFPMQNLFCQINECFAVFWYHDWIHRMSRNNREIFNFYHCKPGRIHILQYAFRAHNLYTFRLVLND